VDAGPASQDFTPADDGLEPVPGTSHATTGDERRASLEPGLSAAKTAMKLIEASPSHARSGWRERARLLRMQPCAAADGDACENNAGRVGFAMIFQAQSNKLLKQSVPGPNA